MIEYKADSDMYICAMRQLIVNPLAYFETENIARAAKEERGPELLTCPFCKEGNFDAIGLRHHLLVVSCKIFDETLTVDEERAQRAAQKLAV
jgi:hypothetical protein